MKLIFLFLIFQNVSVLAADSKLCNYAADWINQKQGYRLGFDGCNYYSGSYSAQILSQPNENCRLEVSFLYGGTQVQCGGTFAFLKNRIKRRALRKANKVYQFCKKFGMEVVSGSKGGNRLTIMVCE